MTLEEMFGYKSNDPEQIGLFIVDLLEEYHGRARMLKSCKMMGIDIEREFNLVVVDLALRFDELIREKGLPKVNEDLRALCPTASGIVYSSFLRGRVSP